MAIGSKQWNIVVRFVEIHAEYSLDHWHYHCHKFSLFQVESRAQSCFQLSRSHPEFVSTCFVLVFLFEKEIRGETIDKILKCQTYLYVEDDHKHHDVHQINQLFEPKNKTLDLLTGLHR